MRKKPPEPTLYAKQLYLRKIQEIDERLTKGDPHELTMVSAPLRLLFLDGDPLAHQVNRGRIKLVFKIVRRVTLPPLATAKLTADYSPLLPYPGYPFTIDVDWDRLLATKCLTIEDEEFSVKEVIKICAHVFGGVHLLKPDLKQKKLVEFSKHGFIGDESAVSLMGSIGHVCQMGLRPLTQSIEADLQVPPDAD